MSEEVSLDSLLSVAVKEISNIEESVPKQSFDDVLSSLNIPTSSSNKDLNNPAITTSNKEKQTSTIHSGDTDSSDDEDNRDFENRKYNNSGRTIKHMLESSKPADKPVKTTTPTSSSWKSNKTGENKSPQVQNSSLFLGLRVVNPLISSKILQERMANRETIPMAGLKFYVRNVPSDKDWVVAGAIVQKSTPKVSQKGKNYLIWTLSDLRIDLKTVCIFLFGSAYKELWKTVTGTVVGILNPSVMELKEGSKDEACLSVDNHQRIMVLGQSKDFGTCKSIKNNGERCTAFVNLSTCEFCLYHIQREYQKSSNRSAIQSSFSGSGLTALRNKVLGKDQVFYAGKLYTSIPARKDKAQVAKDNDRLQALAGLKPMTKNKTHTKNTKQQQKIVVAEMEAGQRRKDMERLKKLGVNVDLSFDTKQLRFEHGEISSDVTAATSKTLALEVINKLKQNKDGSAAGTSLASVKDLQNQKENEPRTAPPKLAPFGGDVPVLSNFGRSHIDLSAPIQRKQAVRAKQNALAWVQNNGPIQKQDPNRNKSQPKKRPIQVTTTSNSAQDEPNPKKCKVQENEFFSDRFKKMMAASSSHMDLLENHDDEAQEQYFKKLEMKERMEEKMLSTYKVPCKAVKCLKCKYTSFSAADRCKAEKHPLKVYDATKRFFKCGGCGNRTVSLAVIPTEACKNCGGGKWERTSMMKEKKAEIFKPTLSIRGGEQTFVNSTITGSNLDLMIPE